MAMRTREVSVPIAGTAFITVEAETEEDAISLAIDEVSLDNIEEWQALLTEDFVGNYWAVDVANPDLAIGFGLSSIGAIADLFEKLPRAASEREERDELAAKWDRARDYAKETVA